MYLDDLSHSTEIVLAERKLRRAGQMPPRPRRGVSMQRTRGSAGRAMAGLLKAGGTLRAAVGAQRPLGAAEAVVMTTVAVLLLALAAIAIVVPAVVTIPIAVLCAWQALSLLLRAYRLYVKRRK
jgi:hypothetical protein